MLKLKKRNLDISTLFKEYLSSLSRVIHYSPSSSYLFDDYWDDYDDGYDYWNEYCSSNSHHISSIDRVCGNKKGVKFSSKRGKRGSKKGKSIPLYSDDNFLYDSDEVTIYFYRDINDPDKKEIFYSLYDFNEYLDGEGIYVSEYETKEIMKRCITHCCVDPYLRGVKNEPWLISDSSYGSLVWQVCGSNDDIIFANNNKEDLPF